MSDDRQAFTTTQDTGTPRWIGVAGIGLAVVTLIALGVGWSASNRSSSLAQTLTAQTQQFKQDEDTLTQRLAKAEDNNTQLQGELSVVADKLKLTGTELHRTASQIKADDAKQLADLQNNVTGQLATKASTDDVNKIGTDVDSVKTDLDATKSNLEMAKGEFGTLIAKNHDQIEELRRMGERDYYEFTITQKGQRTKVGDLMVELRSVNPKRNIYSVAVYVNDQRFDKSNRSVDEPIYFFPTNGGHSAPYEFTVNQVGKNKITGYLSVPKSGPAQAADNAGM
jgi:outer membrane murein-binding lipoprotein Lpp